MRGEAEIGAWELASGCLRYPAAQVLNTASLAMGMLISPRRTLRAWARGRATRNLYVYDTIDHVLARRVDEMREALGLAEPSPRPRMRDLAGIAATIALAPLLVIGSLAVSPRRR